ncbi:rhodanese-like domain-containing protein [Psychrobacter jeotgali]|uniref:rhodanese-like domain-containing protein n=1 Tax=Psychrobacter jeotgali TaxID=179010 RepID=UPI0019182D5A|nr:rhodanese-like domain-containing protein [Psychrobacter jeotgali]
MKAIILSLLLLFGLSTHAIAKDALSVTPESVWNMVQQDADEILFVDVRDPVEIMFIGFTDAVDINIPFRTVKRTELNEDKAVFAMPLNPDFANEVEAALKAKGLDKDALVVTMCRSGSARGKPSADYLLSQGFTNVKYVDHGFQGDTIEEGKNKGFRLMNGWQNSGLPWSPKMNPSKISTTK